MLEGEKSEINLIYKVGKVKFWRSKMSRARPRRLRETS